MILVLGTITILAYVLADFIFENNLHKIKVQNRQDLGQARLNAESGLNLGMSIMKIYKEARNQIEQNENIKSMFPADALDAIITLPFTYPIPELAGMSPVQKSALNEFKKNSLFRGKVTVSTQIITTFLNPNILRIPEQKNTQQEQVPDLPQEDASQQPVSEEEQETPNIQIKKELTNLLTELIKEKQENDELFNAKFSDINPAKLVEELAYFVNEKGKAEGDYIPDIESSYLEQGVTPKHAPLASISELYLLAGWDYEIIDLIKDKLSIHNSAIIPVNKINSKELKIIVPTIHDEEIETFFKYRDGDAENIAHQFKSAEEFKSYLVDTLGVISAAELEEREKELKKAGLILGISSKTFKITTTGEYERARFSMDAYVILPILPAPVKRKSINPSAKSSEEESSKTDGGEAEPQVDPPKKDNEKKGEKPPPEQLLGPRIIEIVIN